MALASASPDAPALVWKKSVVTYRELVRMASSSARQLRALPAGRVGVLAPKSPSSIAVLLGCLMAGRPFVTPSVELGPDALETLLRKAGCAAVLATTESTGERWAGLVDHFVDVGVEDAPLPPEAFTPPADSVTFVLTTSGSTGLPKLVPLTAGAVDRFTDWAAAEFGLRPGSTVLNYAPLNFDLCLLEVWATLKAGGCVVLVEPQRAMNPGYLLDLLTTTDVQLIQAVPVFYQLLLQAVGADATAFPAVEHVLFTGDAMPRHVARALPAIFPMARLSNVYGSTETNDSFVCAIGAEELDRSGPLPIGKPVPGVLAMVTTADGAVLDGPGEGELWVCTPFQTTGYLSEPETGEKFVRHRDETGERVYFRTGDTVRRDDTGLLTLLGRKDFQLKVRGVRINLEEVERALMDHDCVLDAVVTARHDDLAGNRLHAVVQRRPGSGTTQLALRQHCASRLHRVAIPSTFHLCDDPLPRTSTGKVDRQAVADACSP